MPHVSTCHELPLQRPPVERTPWILWTALAILLLPLSGCGAGVIAGGIAGGQNGGGSTDANSITVTPGSGPVSFLSTDFVFRSVLLRGPRVAPDYDFTVRLELPFGTDVLSVEQPVVRQERGGSGVEIQFRMDVEPLQPLVSDPLTTQLETTLVILGQLAGGEPVRLFETGFLLTPTPELHVLNPAADDEVPVLSVDGEELRLRVVGVPDDEPQNYEVEVVLPNPRADGGDDDAIRLRADIETIDAGSAAGEFELVCLAPQVTFSARAAVRVLHVVAGPSTFEFIAYRPELGTAVPRRAPVDGGAVVSVNGRGLVPYDFSSIPVPLFFDAVTLRISKGGRSTTLTSSALLRSLSSLNSLVFDVPPSPDGRPGPATVEVSLRLPELDRGQLVVAQREAVLAYAAAEPDFEPRGVTQPIDVVATAVGRFRGDPLEPGGVDLVMLRADPIGVPFLQVFEGRETGSFTRIGAELQAADRGSQNQRQPVDMVVGSFRGDALDDVLVVVEGATVASHPLVIGRSNPAAPLARSGVAFSSSALPQFGLVRRGDPDGNDDVALFGRTEAHRNSVFASHAADAFAVQQIWSINAIDRIDAAALGEPQVDDGLELIAASGRDGDQSLRLLYGPASAGFPTRVQVPLDGLTRAVSRSVVGAHRVRTAEGLRVVLVFSDVAGPSGLAVFADDGTRSWAEPVVEFELPQRVAPALTQVADIGRDGTDDLVLADQNGSLSVVEFATGGGMVLHEAIAEGLQVVTDLVFAQVAVADADRGRERTDAILVSHRTQVGGRLDARVTTLLMEPDFRVTHPRSDLLLRGPVANVLPAALAPDRAPLAPSDLAVVLGNEIVRLSNDGLGRLEEIGATAVTGLLAGSVARLIDPTGDGRDGLLLLAEDGRLGVLEPGAALVAWSDVPLFVGEGTLLDAKLEVVDLDLDGFVDLAGLLTVQRAAATESLLAFFPGIDPAAATGPLPFDFRDRIGHVLLPGAATDFGLGDFATQDGLGRSEAAVAVPSGSQSGVHFYALDLEIRPYRWRSAAPEVEPGEPPLPPLAGAFGPRLLLATDLEGDGLCDLVLVSRHLDTVQLLRLVASRGTAIEVDSANFTVSAESVTPEGDPVGIHEADIDGDGLGDVILQVDDTTRVDGHRIAVFVLDGLGGIVRSNVLPTEHVGDGGRALCSALADMNGDGLQDLVLGWEGDGGQLPDHVRLLFGAHR